MLKINDKLASVGAKLIDDLSCEEYDSCLAAISAHHIKSLLNNESLSQNDLDFIFSINNCVIKTYDDLSLCISMMIDSARSLSSGACRLKRIFVDKAVFDINFDFDPKVDVYFYGCKIIRNIHPLDGHVIGICESKFKLVEPKFLFSIGKIK